MDKIAKQFYWKSFIDIYDTGKNILLFIGSRIAIIVPHRAFENEEKVQEFFDFVNKKIQESKKQQVGCILT